MRDIKLLAQLILYYAVLGVVIYFLYNQFDVVRQFVITNQQVPTYDNSYDQFSNEYVEEVLRTEVLRTSGPHDIRDLFLGTLGAVLLAFPCAWVYQSVRIKTGMNQALIETAIILPVIVCAVVTIVQHSLALAFSLAGIVAAVRFRHTIRSAADTLFVFASIGIGLAAGVNALGVALVMTLFFNFLLLILFATNFGYRVDPAADNYMRPCRDDEGITSEEEEEEALIKMIK